MVEEGQIAPERVIGDLETVRILADPLRLRLLAALRDRACTVKELAEQVGIAPSKLYYHIELLERHGLVTVVATRVVSGIMEKQYRVTALDFRVDRSLLALGDADDAIDGMLAAVIDTTRAEAKTSARAGSFGNDAEALLGRKVVSLDVDQARTFRRELGELLERFERAWTKCDDARTYNLTVAYFPLC
jgi:DNA-binding transcriptional ArsR family regulator